MGRSCNDKPEMGFGIQMMDDGSVRRVIHSVAQVQPRNYVIMEVKAGLMDKDRKELMTKWDASSGFDRVASVMIGEPPLELKKRGQEFALVQKQEAADIEFHKKRAEEKQKKELEK